MTALEIVRHLRQRGVTLWLEGERLRYRAPKGVLTPSLRAELLANKPQIMDLLRAPERIPREGLLPLSSVQERLWFLEQLDLGNPAYNIARAWRLKGPLNLEVLEESLQAIVQRHEILRAACVTQDGQPGLLIVSELEKILNVTDLRRHPRERWARACAWHVPCAFECGKRARRLWQRVCLP